jgi:hypothetical protein
MPIVIESAGRRQASLQGFLAAVAEGRMAEIMTQAERFGQVFIEAQRPRHRPPDLRYFQRMGEPNSEVIAIGGDKYLRLLPQAPERD